MRVDLQSEIRRAQQYSGIAQAVSGDAGAFKSLNIIHDTEDISDAVNKIQTRLLEEHTELFQRSLLDPDARNQIIHVIDRLIEEEEERGKSGSSSYRISILRESIIERIVGLGVLEPLMQDGTITEIMVNSPTDVFIERAGRLEAVKNRLFANDTEVLQLAQRIVARVGRVLNAENPMVDARLPDGSRVNLVIPPITPFTTITIRRLAHDIVKWQDMLDNKSISPDMVELLQLLVRGRANIVVAGGTGAGKTTLLRQMARFIPDSERIITIEDVDELRLEHPNLVRMEARRGRNSIHQLLVNSLRMRPDRIVIGEVRAEETLDLLEAMGTGHPGSFTTVHAESPQRTVTRIARMMMRGGYEIPYSEILRQIYETVEVIVYCRRMPDYTRRTTHITEVYPDGTFHDLFRLSMKESEDGEVQWVFERANPLSQRLRDKLLENGVWVPEKFLAPVVEKGRDE